ncbi:acetyl-CoA carboxylase biotin carboxyl carrier protein [Flavobacteriaceae bacterium]|jgi:acetyl-CoA carboxylase biotin carboxyl carrier protein|nr:acetyl-CoA carboxylase biotin carboxyl carrier protein [Flavobacteriaceae bacterium]|tara:strand:- start:3206 stop:3676 length:471 start_codon:yes stop_codon:yes gene_type:complete
MNIKDIQQLIKFVAKSGVSEVKIESKDLKIGIKTGLSSKPIVYAEPQGIVSQSVSTPSTEANLESGLEHDNISEDSHLITIKSPIIGTFYRKPSPDKANFIENGDLISEGDVLCVIEAMKLFNEIESEFSGKIVKILVDDSSPVEFDQPLFLLDPS